MCMLSTVGQKDTAVYTFVRPDPTQATSDTAHLMLLMPNTTYNVGHLVLVCYSVCSIDRVYAKLHVYITDYMLICYYVRYVVATNF